MEALYDNQPEISKTLIEINVKALEKIKELERKE